MTLPAESASEAESVESRRRRRRTSSADSADKVSGWNARNKERERRDRPGDELEERSQSAHPSRARRLRHAVRSEENADDTAARRVDVEARRELAALQTDRRDFLRKSAIGAGILALGAGLGYGGASARAAGITGGTRTVITDTEIAARVIGGVRIATEFIPDPVPAGTDADPYPGSAIQAAVNDGLAVYIPSGSWRLTAPISRPVDNVTIIGAGRSTKLVRGGGPCVSAGSQGGWLISNLATDAGGVDISSASETRISEVWVNGVLTDNRPRAAAAATGAGYYGVRATDFVTSGDGTRSSPYNASAIESAINALPAHGGIVFVKAGWYRGPRINLGRTGEGGRAKSITIQGESADLSGLNTENYDAVGGDDLFGTALECGFRINTYGCQIAFQNLVLLPPATGGETLKFEGKLDDEAITSNNALPIGGFRIQDCKFMGGDPAIWITGLNTGDWGHQNWNVLIERIHIREAERAIRIDDDGGNLYDSIFRGNLRHIIIQASAGDGTAPAVFVDIANLKGDWTDWLIEDSGQTGPGAYCLYVRAARTEGFQLSNVDFGDAIRSPKTAYFENYLSGQMTIRGFVFHKDVDLNGFIDFEGGLNAFWGGPGRVNTANEGSIVIRKMRGLSLPLGAIATPANVTIEIAPGKTAGPSGEERASIKPGTSGNRGVLKMWDATAGAYRYASIENGAWVISSTEPS